MAEVMDVYAAVTMARMKRREEIERQMQDVPMAVRSEVVSAMHSLMQHVQDGELRFAACDLGAAAAHANRQERGETGGE